MAGVISDKRTEHGIPHTVTCHALGVSESWFYKWRDRRPTGRELHRQRLADEIKESFTESGGTYGSPKIFILLVRKGGRISVNTVAKLMAGLGLVARKGRRRSGLTRPGKLYLAAVFDLFSRRLLGYAMGAHHDADLVVAALNVAAATRGGDVRGVIFHSDRGSECGSRKFARACRRLGGRGPWAGSARASTMPSARRSTVSSRSSTRPAPHLPHPHRGPDQDRHLDHRLPQRPPTAQHVRVQEPDRLRERVLGRPHRGTGCIGRTPRFEGIDRRSECTGG
ncbi:DDE-type integrase/transposase/recombinase [Streptomyces sp. NPDC085479]|uniref:DDE-type integrase/transposase/recombinase n=1 Tax=Streptomyces sp. NPDC085479 TaxID=3365726 RepID=UPI0037D5844C